MSRGDLIEAYTLSLIRWGTFSKITIDAVTRDWANEMVIYVDDELRFQGNIKFFRIACKL